MNTINQNEVYFINDQPVTCPQCGNRTFFSEELIDNFKNIQFHKCLSFNCNFEFQCIEEININKK